MPQQSWNSLSSRDKLCGNRLRQCRRVAARRWPIFVASISVVGAALGPRLGVGLNASRSAPRGVYRQLGDAPNSGSDRGGLSARLGPGDTPAAQGLS